MELISIRPNLSYSTWHNKHSIEVKSHSTRIYLLIITIVMWHRSEIKTRNSISINVIYIKVLAILCSWWDDGKFVTVCILRKMFCVLLTLGLLPFKMARKIHESYLNYVSWHNALIAHLRSSVIYPQWITQCKFLSITLKTSK